MPAMTGQQVRDYIVDTGFKRDDKDTEIFYALTDVIRELRNSFTFQETGTDATTTDTISVLGDYRINVDAEFGLLIGDVIMADSNVGYQLNKLTKDEFDRRYPNPSNAYYRGVPKDWCMFGNQVLIGPPPDSTSYTYKMSYSADDDAVDITAATTAVPFSSKYREMLKHGVLASVYADLGDDANAAKHKGIFEEKKYKAVQRELKNAGAYEYVQPRDV